MIHSCSYYCHKPECIKAQRNELRDKLFKREWVGLTEAEQQELYDTWIKINDGWGSFYALIEAKLKEKNT